MVGMLHQLLHPGITDEDSLLTLVLIRDLEPLFVGLLNDVLHILPPQSAENTKEKLLLRQLT